MLTLLAAGAASGEEAGKAAPELLCAPSTTGCVTTWLVAGPVRFLRVPELDTDFLAASGGEAAARPRDGAIAPGAKDATWQTVVFPEAVVDLKERCLPLGRSAFYLSATLVPRRDVEATLVVSHTGSARLWLDGRKAATSDPDPMGLGPRTVEQRLSLRADKRVQCLLKMGSEGRHLQLLVRLLKGRRGIGPRDVAVALPQAAGAAGTAERHVRSALSLGLGAERFIQPGKAATVVLGVEGGYPLHDVPVAATVAIADSAGRAAAKLTVPPAALAALAETPASLAWTPPKDAASPFYTLTAQVTCGGRKLGELVKTVYSPSDIGRWTADLHKRLVAVSAERKLAGDRLAHVLLKIEKAALLQQGGEVRSFAPDRVYEELETAKKWLDRFERGEGLPPIGPGEHEAAYLAEQDDSAQPYFLHIPSTYTGKTPVPAIVYLHGYAPWLDKTNWHELSYGLSAQADARGYAIVCPFARSNTDFQAIGEVDVLHALKLAQQRVKIDPDRVFLLGYSMGGMGAYTIAAHYPHLWAGCVVMCGRADYFFWKGLDPAKVEPFKRHLLDMEFGWPLAANFLHVPVLAHQGTADILIKPEQAYRFVARLKSLGSEAQLVRLEGQSHWIADETFSTPRAFDWMDARRRPAAPRRVRFKTYSLLYPRAYWATIDAFTRWGQPASIDVELKDGNRLTVSAQNVARLTLRPPAALCDPAQPFHVGLGGKTLELKPADGALTVDIAPLPAAPLRKTPALCGPIKDVFNRRFLLVRGTGGGAQAARHNQELAQSLQKDWYRFAKGFRGIKRDTDVTDAEMARSNLVLFGTPATNAVLGRIAAKLPIRFTPRGYEILGRTFEANDKTGLMFIYPNPLAPTRTVVVCSGLHYGAKLGDNHKYDLLPDFIVYSDEPDYDDSNSVYCAGFFDTAWQLDPKLTWTSNGRARPTPAAPGALDPWREPAPVP